MVKSTATRRRPTNFALKTDHKKLQSQESSAITISPTSNLVVAVPVLKSSKPRSGFLSSNVQPGLSNQSAILSTPLVVDPSRPPSDSSATRPVTSCGTQQTDQLFPHTAPSHDLVPGPDSTPLTLHSRPLLRPRRPPREFVMGAGPIVVIPRTKHRRLVRNQQDVAVQTTQDREKRTLKSLPKISETSSSTSTHISDSHSSSIMALEPPARRRDEASKCTKQAFPESKNINKTAKSSGNRSVGLTCPSKVKQSKILAPNSSASSNKSMDCKPTLSLPPEILARRAGSAGASGATSLQTRNASFMSPRGRRQRNLHDQLVVEGCGLDGPPGGLSSIGIVSKAKQKDNLRLPSDSTLEYVEDPGAEASPPASPRPTSSLTPTVHSPPELVPRARTGPLSTRARNDSPYSAASTPRRKRSAKAMMELEEVVGAPGPLHPAKLTSKAHQDGIQHLLSESTLEYVDDLDLRDSFSAAPDSVPSLRAAAPPPTRAISCNRTGPLNPCTDNYSPHSSASASWEQRSFLEDDIDSVTLNHDRLPISSQPTQQLSRQSSDPFGFGKAEKQCKRLREIGELEKHRNRQKSALLSPVKPESDAHGLRSTVNPSLGSDLSLSDLLPIKGTKKNRKPAVGSDLKEQHQPSTKRVQRLKPTTTDENDGRIDLLTHRGRSQKAPASSARSFTPSHVNRMVDSDEQLDSSDETRDRRKVKLRRVDPNTPNRRSRKPRVILEKPVVKDEISRTSKISSKRSSSKPTLQDEETGRKLRLNYYQELDNFDFEEEVPVSVHQCGIFVKDSSCRYARYT